MAYFIRNGRIILRCDACGEETETNLTEIVEQENPEIPDLCFDCATAEYGDICPC